MRAFFSEWSPVIMMLAIMGIIIDVLSLFKVPIYIGTLIAIIITGIAVEINEYRK